MLTIDNLLNLEKKFKLTFNELHRSSLEIKNVGTAILYKHLPMDKTLKYIIDNYRDIFREIYNNIDCENVQDFMFIVQKNTNKYEFFNVIVELKSIHSLISKFYKHKRYKVVIGFSYAVFGYCE